MRSGVLRAVLASSFVLALTFVSASANAQASNLVDLGTATGYAINNAGQVVLSTGIYSSGTVTALPALVGSTTPAVPLAINDTGQVAGFAVSSTGIQHAIGYSNGTLTDLTAGGLVSDAAATGINASGTVVGWSTCPAAGASRGCEPYAVTTGFIYSNGTFTGLSNLPSGDVDTYIYNQAYGVNDSGQMTGSAAAGVPNNPGGSENDAYIYNISNGTWVDIGEGTGYAINATGQVTGALSTASGSRAFLYTNGVTTNIGTLPGGNNAAGTAINTTGQAVGYSNFTGSAGSHAFFYNGAMNDLNSLISATDPLKPYVTLTSAVGINDSLLILANGVDSRTNLTHAYLYQASFIELAPIALNFAQAVGGTSQLQSVTVTNAGTTAIPLGTASVNGDFSLRTDSCGASLAPGAQCTIGVVFVPKVIGVLTGALTIPSAGANYQVPLSGVAPITATISASANTMTVGKDVTITWSASAGTSCIWQASTSPGNPIVPSTGSKVVTASTASSVTYSILCSFAGLPAAEAQVVVQWTWPAVTATLTASPTTITAGQSTTLTWNSSNATSCAATGGGSDDNWAGAKAPSGTQTVTEAVALDNSVVLTFVITCNSMTSGLSGKASATVTDNPAPASSGAGGGGGGAMNPLSLALLAGIFALRRMLSFAS